MDDLIIRWTARLAVGCYAARLIYDLTRPATADNSRVARGWWTVGCVIFAIHVAAAFHFAHHWNHARAYAYTAERTAEMTGWNSGVGLYINEIFLSLWIFDTVLWWRNLDWPRNRPVYWAIQAIFAFLMFQATAVFGPPLWRPIVAVFILWLFYEKRHRRRPDQIRPI